MRVSFVVPLFGLTNGSLAYILTVGLNTSSFSFTVTRWVLNDIYAPILRGSIGRKFIWHLAFLVRALYEKNVAIEWIVGGGDRTPEHCASFCRIYNKHMHVLPPSSSFSLFPFTNLRYNIRHLLRWGRACVCNFKFKWGERMIDLFVASERVSLKIYFLLIHVAKRYCMPPKRWARATEANSVRMQCDMHSREWKTR